MDPGTALTLVERIDSILKLHAADLGDAYPGYRNHACRVALHCVDLAPPALIAADEIAIASAFHDLGIWTARTFDYLEPSAALADAYVEAHAPLLDRSTVRRMILDHHQVTRTVGLAEAFRRADLVDVTGGLFTFGIPRSTIRERFRAFPAAGFHRRLLALTWQRMRSHPFDPLPMVRW